MNDTIRYVTQGGIQIERTASRINADQRLDDLVRKLDEHRGALFSSGYDDPGRYSRWDMGFYNPPIAVTAHGLSITVESLNQRGECLIAAIASALSQLEALDGELSWSGEAPYQSFVCKVKKSSTRFAEEERSRQPSSFSVLRAIVKLFCSSEDSHLGLYGAFGYDLCFQFEPIEQTQPRTQNQRTLVLYLPDRIQVVDRQKEQAFEYAYDFEYKQSDGLLRTHGLPGGGSSEPYQQAAGVEPACDHAPGEYAASVTRAKESFKRGDLFELVLSQTFTEPCERTPSSIYRHLQQANPAPYALFINLGEKEYLVGASPEMYVRVEGNRVETCPISGTIPRGTNAIEDATRIQELLNSKKDESELTMCTDVDRNDKSRICEAGSVQVIGRRQLELYSRLIHTVDHVEGRLRPEFDALDAFLSHTWAVTVTGAPKPAAIQAVERAEKSERAWYGGAIGKLGFDGGMNTGLTLRTVRIKDGIAQVRAGATLLFDSDPEAEEAETRVKASAFLDSLKLRPTQATTKVNVFNAAQGKRILLVDHQDSFVHTLANYLRQTGAEVVTLRAGFDESQWDVVSPDIVVLSPGPGSPREFRLRRTIDEALRRQLPVFGVCLGLQGIVEYFGGALSVLDYPMHGKPSDIEITSGTSIGSIGERYQAARYHSLYADPSKLPKQLRISARSLDGVIMGVEHEVLPVCAVQFHPESILTLSDNRGLRLLNSAMAWLLERAKLQSNK